MRKSLRWSLTVTCFASVAALWLDTGDMGGATTVVDARVLTPPPNERYANWRDSSPAPQPQQLPPLPSALPDRDTDAGRSDIFTPVTLAPPPLPPAPTPPPPAPAPAPAPAPPAMNWRAIGSMVTPAGERIVWLAKGSDEITVKPGMYLDDGYVVQSVDADQVVLVYPPIGTTAKLFLPHGQLGSP